MGQLKSFATSRVSFWLGKCHFFWKKKILLKSVLQFTQVCPCVGLRKCAPAWKEKFFFAFFFENCLYFCFTNTKKKRTRKKNLGLTVYASVPLHWFTQVCPCMKSWNCLFFCFTCRKKERAKKNIFFTRCGLSSTYHLVPLTLLQYDTKPTRQYDSIMLIHDSLDTGVFQYHPSTIQLILRAPRLLRARCCLLRSRIIGSSPLSQTVNWSWLVVGWRKIM